MRIACISDTHGMHDEIRRMPAADILIHSGDLSAEGVPAEIFEAFAWLSTQPYERIVTIPGNHDFALESVLQLPRVLKSKFPNVEVLMDSETVVNGLRVFGSPFTPWFNDWAFNFLPGPAGIKQAEDKWAQIPDDTTILITHGPVYGILDETLRKKRVGCVALKDRIARLPNLRLYVSGPYSRIVWGRKARRRPLRQRLHVRFAILADTAADRGGLRREWSEARSVRRVGDVMNRSG